MKCLKVDEYIKRTASVRETELLFHELENYVKGKPGLQGRTLCDRIIRACNHQLGVGGLDLEHIAQLVKLMELSLHGYDIFAALVLQSNPLYMEKIVFHIVKKLSSIEVHTLCSHIAGLLYSRLSKAQQDEEDYCVLVRSCFSVLWNGLSAAKDKKILNPQDKLRCQMQALSFLLLLDTENATPSLPKAVVYIEDIITEFESSCGVMTKEDTSILLQEMNTLFNTCWTGDQDSDGDGSKQRAASRFYVLSEMVLIILKVLCKAGHHRLASSFLSEIERKASEFLSCQCTAVVLAKWGVMIHSTVKAGDEARQALTECARAVRSVSGNLGDREGHALLEGCSFVVWAVDSGYDKGLSGPVLLALFSFFEEHQECVMRILNKNLSCQAECSRLQKSLCFSIYKGFEFAYESMLASELEDSDTLERVLLYCQATAGLMMTELHKLSSENIVIKAVIAVSNLACGLYNRRLYEKAFILVEILCRDLCKNCPASLSVDRLSRPFMLAVQTSRRTGQYDRALDWVILWLKALGDKITAHMTEPVSLWVKTKTDAACNSEGDIRLRTLRDGFGPDVPDENVMLRLLEEELSAYKEMPGDTAQERYNTLCDLLDICHEESSHIHLRAVYLCEMAKVVCFQDFSEQTDCSAVDFIHEALRLLDEEPETPENADKLKDDKAHALLWLYICTLEKTLQEAIDSDRKRKELREQTQCVTNSIGNNDFDYEDKQKTQDSIPVYEGLHFNLTAEHKLCQPLESALDIWTTIFQSETLPSVREPKETCRSIGVTASLFRLMGKPLQALKALQILTDFSRQLADNEACASSLIHSASILLDLGSTELAQTQLDQVESVLPSNTAEGSSSLSLLAILVKAQCHYNNGQIDCGLRCLIEVLKELKKQQKQSKSWYLLRARTLQTSASFLSIDAALLPQVQKNLIMEQGISTSDGALYESLKLLCSLLVTLVGKGLYGTTTSSNSSTNVAFINQGDNLALKWQLLAELLNCSKKMVSVRSDCGAINDARLQCLEALKLAIKLQTLSQCSELLVIKAELELMQGEKDESRTDLDIVRNLLERSTDFSDQVQRAEVKIKPRKGRPVQRPQSPLPTIEDDLKDILSTRWTSKEPIVKDLSGSPPLKALPHRWLSSLTHEPECQCPCCSEPCLGRATARWAAAQADLLLQLDPNDTSVSSKLQWATLSRSKTVTAKLGVKLAKLFPLYDTGKIISKPSLMQDIVGRVYLHMALSGVDPSLTKVCAIWKILEAGLAFVESTPSPMLRPVRAGLMTAKAIASLISLAAKNECTPEELFSKAWTWNMPKEGKDLKSEQKTDPPASVLKKSKDVIKNSVTADPKKEAKKTRSVKSKIRVTSSSTKEKSQVPITPVTVKSYPFVKELSSYDFNTAVPTLALTPVQKVRCPASAQKPSRTAPKLQFHVYEELSPVQGKAQPVPAAPKRTKKSRFKVEFSDESDSEANAQAEPKVKAEASKTRTTARRAGHNTKTTPDAPAEKVPPKRQVRGKKSTVVPRAASSEDETLVCRPGSTRRTRKQASADAVEEPDTMRTIEEETPEILDMSIEQLRTSDAEDNSAASKDNNVDFEVLRRDMCGNLERDELFVLRSRGHLRENAQIHLSHADSRPDNLTLEDVQSLLHSAWLTLQHFPPPTLYPTLCALLALTTGQQNSITTAMLHSHSVGITSRHRTIRHIASCLKKLKKASSELEDKMHTLSLNELTQTVCEQRLTQMENIFSFPTADPSTFPETHGQEFIQQIQHLPSGVTACVMSVMGVKPGEMGNSIMLTRLEKSSAPVTVYIDTSKQKHPISQLVQEMDSILVEQKVVSCVSEKAKWWEGRRTLDSRVEQLLKDMERLLGCWRTFLLPLSLDAELSKQTQHLYKALSARGVPVQEEMLKVLLSASPVLSEDDLKRFTLGVSPQWDTECDQLLHTAVSQLLQRDEPRNHVVLILDKYLQKLPWESIPVLKSSSVSRMPSLHSLLGLSIQKETDSESILRRGVDAKKVFYVLDPDDNLGNSQERFKDWFCSKPDWEGVCGAAPALGRLEEAVATKDVYIYVGHGAGARFLDSQAVLKRPLRAASLLFGCSSGALAVRGQQEGNGIVLNYIIAGCPFILGNLWDVTDRDIDRFTKALLESWFSAGSGAPLLDFMGSSRQATHLKYLIGSAPVVYGLPVHLS
ncbi:separin [Neolamprologus brichardi]|uniref:separin n=1 Tax=Neolamprologus brichardi TaxID=32507 RepID=UPI0003EC5F18|nr:separin [Neolamprologus brichardi]